MTCPWGGEWTARSVVNFPPYIKDRKYINHAALIGNKGNYQFVLYSDMSDVVELRVPVTYKAGKTLVRAVFDAQESGHSGYLREFLAGIDNYERDSNGAICEAVSFEEWRFRV